MNIIDQDTFDSLKSKWTALGNPTSRQINKTKALQGLKTELLSVFPFFKDAPAKIAHILWCLENDVLGESLCEYCKIPHSEYNSKGERRRCCCRACVSAAIGVSKIGTKQSDETKHKRKRTNVKKTGYENPMHNPESRLKQQKTVEGLYGASNPMKLERFRTKQKQTMKARYGKENPSQVLEFKQKGIETCRANHGVDFPMQSESVKAKSKQTNLERRNVEFPSQCPIVRQKIITTLQHNYQVDNPMKSSTVIRGIIQNNLEHWGVEWYFQTDEFKTASKESCMRNFGVEHPLQSHIVQSKIVETSRTKYNTDRPSQSDEVKRKMVKTTTEIYGAGNYNQRHITDDALQILNDKILLEAHLLTHHSIAEAALDLNVNPTTYYKRLVDHRIFINSGSFAQQAIAKLLRSKGLTVAEGSKIPGTRYELDIFIPSHNIAIEFNGVYWHSTKFRPDPMYHLNKTKMCEERDIRLIQIFEDEWETRQSQVEAKLLSILGADVRHAVYAKTCQVVELKPRQTAQFLNDHHIQGKTRTQLRYGLEHDGELVAVMTFNKGTATNAQYLELNRYATSKRVVGGFSKLLNHFWKMNPDIDKIVSFADRRYSSVDNMYSSNGWELVNITRPSYTVLVGMSRVRREHFMKHKLEKMLENYDPNLTERENCENHGLYRIYDCGLLKYEMKNPLTNRSK